MYRFSNFWSSCRILLRAGKDSHVMIIISRKTTSTQIDELMQKAQSVIVAVRHPYATRRHDDHASRHVELPERLILAAPGPRTFKLAGDNMNKKINTSQNNRVQRGKIK